MRIDWEAVGAVGTWAVGFAAIWLAIKANGIAASLRKAGEEREGRAARTMVLGLRLETLHYEYRIKHLSDVLSELAKKPGFNPANRAAEVFETAEKAGLTDVGQKMALVPHLPEELGRQISFLFADEAIARATFRNSAQHMRKLERLELSDESSEVKQMLGVIADASEAHRSLAGRVFEVLNAMTTYLGLPPDEDFMAR